MKLITILIILFSVSIVITILIILFSVSIVNAVSAVEVDYGDFPAELQSILDERIADLQADGSDIDVLCGHIPLAATSRPGRARLWGDARRHIHGGECRVGKRLRLDADGRHHHGAKQA